MPRKADLHVHTYYSDGTFSPSEVVKKAKRIGLSAIAVCDHDCTDGMDECLSEGERHGVEIIPGVEITCESEGIEIHLLGYFIDKDARPLTDLLDKLRDNRIKRIYAMVDKLNRHDVGISPGAVFGMSSRGSIGRLHLAMALYENGFVPSVKEAFARYIGDNSPCYVSRFNVSPEEAISTVLGSGGVPVYAHPGVMGRDDLIPSFMKAGLRGLEVYHTDHSKKASAHYSELAEKYGLLATGGSDCHGAGKGRVLMGGVTVPYSVVDDLRKESQDVRGENTR
jgi:hypothetical protein